MKILRIENVEKCPGLIDKGCLSFDLGTQQTCVARQKKRKWLLLSKPLLEQETNDSIKFLGAYLVGVDIIRIELGSLKTCVARQLNN